jgi:hypothetical protein
MNTLLLLFVFKPWNAPSSTSVLTRIFMAISVFSVEMQVVTWVGLGSLRTLVVLNLLVVIVAQWMRIPAGRRRESLPVPFYQSVPAAAALFLAAIVLVLNVANPLEAVDQYNMDRVDRIGAGGTLAYDSGGEVKTNILSPVYEMVLADLRQTPLVGPVLLRLHGLLGLWLYLVAIGTVRELLGARSGWRWALMLAVPVVFHQLVLVKNDLFVGVLGLVALAWVVARARDAEWSEIAWVSWLTGFAVAVKLTSLPLLVILAGAILVQRRGGWRPMAGVVLGGLVGALAGGLIFTLVENIRVYGVIMPSEEIGNRFEEVVAMLVGLGRFGVSLVDLGLLTRIWWPGRGGWGSTFGLPLVWAVVVVASQYRRSPGARCTALIAAVHFVSFAAVFPDADLHHRLALAPGLLLISVAVAACQDGRKVPMFLRMASIPVLALSSAQIVRSAVLYLTRT